MKTLILDGPPRFAIRHSFDRHSLFGLFGLGIRAIGGIAG
jgi:hypothetical protein